MCNDSQVHLLLYRMVHDTDIVELELRSKRFSLAVRKKEAIEAMEPQVVYQVRLHPYIALHMTWTLIGIAGIADDLCTDCQCIVECCLTCAFSELVRHLAT